MPGRPTVKQAHSNPSLLAIIILGLGVLCHVARERLHFVKQGTTRYPGSQEDEGVQSCLDERAEGPPVFEIQLLVILSVCAKHIKHMYVCMYIRGTYYARQGFQA